MGIELLAIPLAGMATGSGISLSDKDRGIIGGVVRGATLAAVMWLTGDELPAMTGVVAGLGIKRLFTGSFQRTEIIGSLTTVAGLSLYNPNAVTFLAVALAVTTVGGKAAQLLFNS